MTDSDLNLLRRFNLRGDPEAFAQITHAYADMVYGTCLRITGNQDTAADAVQDTFFHLLRNAGKVTGSLGGWLHRVATRRAIDVVRLESARRQRERAYAVEEPVATDQWAEVSPLVDEALNELEASQRDVIIRHFLQGETTVQIAASQHVAQSTISRHLELALAQLRERLRAKDVLVATATLSAWLSQAAATAPTAVLTELGKMAVAASGGAAGSAAAAAVGGLKLKLAAAAVVTSVGIGGYIAYKHNRSDTPSHAAIAQAPPNTDQAATEPATVPAKAPSPRLTGNDTAASPGIVLPDPPPSSAAAQGTPAAPAALMGGARFSSDQTPTSQPIGFGGFGTRMATAPSPTSPKGAVHRLAVELRRGDWTRLEQCFVPGSAAFTGFQRLLQNPQNDEERSMKQCLESLGLPTEIVDTTPWEDGLKVKWKATVHKAFSLVEDGTLKNWQEADQFELEVRLKKVGEDWRIAGF